MKDQPQVICLGQAIVDCITLGWDKTPVQKNVYRAQSISLSVGGDAFNESVILTRLGHRVRLICGIGKDAAGDLILSQMSANGLDHAGVTCCDGAATPVADLLVEPGGERQSISSPASKLEFFSPTLEGLSGYRVLSLASLFRAPLDDPQRLLELVRAAKKQGAVICADTKMPSFRALSLGDMREVLPYLDYIFPNENEAAYYTGREQYQDMAAVLLEMGVGHVVIKTGPAGCFCRSGEGAFSLPAFPVKALDSTGAGDNFAAGFISSLLHGEDFYHSCRFGAAAAAICVTGVGSTAAVKSRRQVEDFLAEQQDTLSPALPGSSRALRKGLGKP